MIGAVADASSRLMSIPVFSKLARRGSRNFLIVSASSMAGVAVAFLRGVILAHLLPPVQFGLAVILITIVGALDMFADAGLDKFVIQSRFGYREDVLRTSHFFRVVGSLLVGATIVALARPLALLFHALPMAAAIAACGGVVGLRGFIDLRYKLQQRAHRFDAEARIEVVRALVEAAVLLGGTLLFHSYWVVLAGAYANAVVQVGMSYLADARHYNARPKLRLMGMVGKFSTPIYLNAALLFAAVQGDRMVVATLFAKSDLAFYTVACAIGQGLTVVLNRITTSMLLPKLARRDGDPTLRRRRANQLGFAMLGLSTAFLVAMTLGGPLATQLIYGFRFHGLLPIIYASSIVNMIQVEQAWVSTLLMANGRTSSFPITTVMRASAVPVAILFTQVGASLLAVPMAFAVGAALSLATTYYAARSLRLIDRRLILGSLGRIVALIAAAPALAAAFPVGGPN